MAAIPETNYVVDDKQKVIDRVVGMFKDQSEPDYLDGVTFQFKDGSWLNVRPSNTESVLRVNVEAPNKEELDKLVAKVTSCIKA